MKMWDVKKPHFLLGFDPALNSRKLKIPSKFATNLEGSTSGTVLLEGPSGNSWRANLVHHDDGLFFHNGWEAFVTDNFIEQGDSLVFRYDGHLSFTVQVFDHSSCEKEDSFKAVCSQDPINYVNCTTTKRDRENSLLLDGIIEGVPKKMRSSHVYSDCISKNHEMNTYIADKEGCLQEEMVCFGETAQASHYIVGMGIGTCALKNSVTVAVPLQSVVSNDNSEVTIGKTGKECLISAWEAEKIARTFTSSFPNFTKVMKRFNISGSYTLNIPYQFAMVHLPKCKLKIVLSNLKGESWTVNSIPTTRVQTSHTFCGGWLAFVRGNHINVGDICIFELVRMLELRVRIVRVGKAVLDDSSCKLVHEDPVNGCTTTTSDKIPGRRTKKLKGNSRNMFSLQARNVEISNKKRSDFGSALYSLSRICNGESDVQRRDSVLQKQGSQAKGFMSMKSAPEEKLAAQSFVSSFPHFVRIMKKFNVRGSYTLKIPYQFSMEHLPNFRTEIILHNLDGQCWTVNSVPSTKVRTLHTFCGGWMAFVRDNEIQMGDICIFELVGECEMRVYICGIGKKGLNYPRGRAISDEPSIRSLSSNPLV